MADIQERQDRNGKTKYTARIRIRGHRPQSATFGTLTEAKRWAQRTEADIRRGVHLPEQESKRRTLAETIASYMESSAFQDKSESTQYGQAIQLNHWTERLGHVTLAGLTPTLIADERDHLLKGETTRKASGKLDRATKSKGKAGSADEVNKRRSPATVTRYLAALSHCLTWAQKEKGWINDNPMRNVTKPKEPRGRVRILSEEERDALLAACSDSKNPDLHDLVVLLLSTAARRNEIAHMEWRHVDFDRRVIVLDKTKNGDRRVIPVRGKAEKILEQRSKIRRIENPYVFAAPARRDSKPRPVNFQSAWDWAIERAKLEDFRMHDLRHSAASYLAMNGATLAELAEVLGHKTLQMVKRYSHFTEGHTGALVERMNDAVFGVEDTKDEAAG